MAETFHGYIETTQDVLLIFEGCRRGLIPRVCRRLQEKERRMIRSGSIFVFDERESGIKRWTDGLVWSPSRILGNFLIYRELDKRVPGDKKLSISSASSLQDSRQRSYSADQTGNISNDRSRERRLVGSLSDSYRFRKDGLIKKTMSIIVNGVAQHLISYYLPNDIISNKLRTPSSVPELANLEISPDLLVKQNFRIPPMVEPQFDHSETALTDSSASIDAAGHNPYSTDDRRIHPFRSMSLGSLRSSSNYQNNSLSAAGRPDMNNPNLMYTTSSLSQRMDIDDDNNPNKLANNLSAYYGNNQYNINGFPPLPSPSSMTSSPNTPMLSPVRQSFSSQPIRHYSMSSSSSGSIGRYNNSRSSFDISNSIHPHIIPEITYDQRSGKNENDTTQQGGNFSSSPNIGQLLNPVHPLNATSSSILKQESNNNELFQTMDMSNTDYSDYNSTSNASKLPSIPQTQTQNNDYSNTYGGNYYIQRPQQQQPLTNTHSASVTNNVVPMFRNGIAHPPSMYDDTQNGSELGMEPLMLK